MKATIWHNPACGTSRNTLAMLTEAGAEVTVVEYLKTPPSRALLEQLIARSGIAPRALLRQKGTPFADLGLDDQTLPDAALIDAIVTECAVVEPDGTDVLRLVGAP